MRTSQQMFSRAKPGKSPFPHYLALAVTLIMGAMCKQSKKMIIIVIHRLFLAYLLTMPYN